MPRNHASPRSRHRLQAEIEAALAAVLPQGVAQARLTTACLGHCMQGETPGGSDPVDAAAGGRRSAECKARANAE